jgi:hypothetical protein
MRMPTEGTNSIEARLARLEAQNRRWKQGALLCLLAISTVGLMAQTQTTKPKTTTKKPAPPAAPAAPAAPVIPEKLQAESFVLVDQAGHDRAELAMGGTGPSFRLLSTTGSALVTISLNDSAAGGSAPGGPVLLLSDPSHKAGLTMSVLDGAGSQLSLMGENKDAQVHMAVTKDGSAVELFDENGFSTSLGNGMKVSKSGKAQETSAASIALYNKDRKVLWSAP